MHQYPNEGIHFLNTKISTLINSCRFANNETKETLKIMVLQHVVRYHEAHNWIQLQNQSQLTYQTLLNHCQLLKS